MIKYEYYVTALSPDNNICLFVWLHLSSCNVVFMEQWNIASLKIWQNICVTKSLRKWFIKS